MQPYFKNILLADDDSDDIFLFTYALKRLAIRCNITTAADGQALVDKVLSADIVPDIILTDINMPALSGLEALNKLKNIPSIRSVPVVVYSTSANESDAREAYEYGAKLYAVKPNTIDGLVRLLERLLTLDWKNFSTPDRQHFVVRSLANPAFQQEK